MRSTALNQSRARRYARRAQGAFLVVGTCALAAAVWGSRPRPVPEVEPLGTAVETPAGPEKHDDHQPVSADAYGIAKRLNSIANPPKSENYVAPVDPDEGKVVTQSDQSIRFLGLLIEPNRRLALLKIGDRQRLLVAGESVPLGGEQTGTLRVVEVADTHVIVETGGVQKRIEKSIAQGPAVTYLTGVAPSPTPTGRAPGSSSDPAARARALGRQMQTDNPVIPPPGGARLMPADRRPPESTGERQ